MFTSILGRSKGVISNFHINQIVYSKVIKTICYLVLLLITKSVPILAQIIIQESGVSVDLNDVVFIDANNGWAVGDSGTIVVTKNGGHTWMLQQAPTNASLYRVVFPDSLHGYSISKRLKGEPGSIFLATYDGGQGGWKEIAVRDSLDLRGIFFLDTERGWVSGRNMKTFNASLLQTTDSGETWTDVSENIITGSYINDVHFVNNDTGWVFNTCYTDNFCLTFVYKTTNGGDSWTKIGHMTGATSKINFVSADTLWASGPWYFGTSFDGGENWSDRGIFSHTAPISGSEAWFTRGKTMYFTADGGKTSEIIETLSERINSIYGIGNNEYWVVGDNGLVGYFNNDIISSVENTEQIPQNFSLRQNFPNPFNPITSISFKLKKSDNIQITIYNVNGQIVKVLASEKYTPGSHTLSWNGRDNSNQLVSSGIYFYRLTSSEISITRKMTLIR